MFNALNRLTFHRVEVSACNYQSRINNLNKGEALMGVELRALLTLNNSFRFKFCNRNTHRPEQTLPLNPPK
jgi:hypothetical protein